MKRLITLLLTMALAVTMLLTPVFHMSTEVSAKTKFMYVELKPSVTSMKLVWDKQKVDYYEVYRADVTKNIKKYEYSLDENKYKKIAKVSKSKKSYTDKKVKNGKYYAYVVKGFKKTKGKYKKVYSSYLRGMTYDYVGLFRPQLNESPTEEDIDSDANLVILNINSSYGAKPKKYIVYRKAEGEKKFTKIKIKNYGRRYDSNIYEYKDDSVETHTKYEYKVKAYAKAGKKKYYSKFSKVFTVTPSNAEAKFSAEAITAKGNVDTIVIKMVSDKKNGVLDLSKNSYEDDCKYFYKEAYGSDMKVFGADLIGYSYDNSSWINIGTYTLSIPAGKTVYLKYKLYNINGETTPIYFGAQSGETSELEIHNAKYHGPNPGYTQCYIDFLKGIGKAYMVLDE